MDIKKFTRSYRFNLYGITVLLFAVIIFPFLVPSNYIISTFILIGLYGIVCTGLVVLMGHAGQISLGHAAFYGIGAYSSAIVSGKFDFPPLAGVLTGILIACIVALLIGIPSFKLKEHYLALATLGFGVIVFTFLKEWTSLTGGLNGFFGIPPFEVAGFSFTTDRSFYFLVWAVLAIGLWFANNLIHSRTGRALKSIHGSESAAESIGINLMTSKLKALIISAVFASVAGSLYAHYISFINPQLFEVMTSIVFLIMVVIGGSSSLWGGLAGAIIYVWLVELLKDWVPLLGFSTGGEFEIVFFGVLLVVLLIFKPEGLMGSWKERKTLFSPQKKKVQDKKGAAL
jgi:branched-chain amino acid transport system permease protein